MSLCLLTACSIPVSGDAPTSAPTAPGTTAPPSTAASEPDSSQDEGVDAPADTGPSEGEAYLFARVEFEAISDDDIAAVLAVPGVAAVDAPRTDDTALFASARSDGTAVDALPDDFKVSLAAVVEEERFAPPLAAGEVALTTTALQFRDLDVGGSVTLVDRTPRRVVAILDDPALRDVEIVVAAEDADVLGHRERQRARIALTGDRPADEVAEDVAATLGTNATVQVRRTDDRPMVLSLPQTKAWFGEFAFEDLDGRDIRAGASWIEANIVQTEVPLLGRVVCHRALIPPLTAALETIIERGLAGEIDPSLYGGCWAPRRINRNANLSRHAWGIAVDINVDFTAPGLGPIPSEGVIEAFEEQGFRWGGDYPLPDNHHFELVEPPTAG